MAFDKHNIYDFRFLVLMLIGLPLIASTNIDCSGKSFHCLNATHFMICVDFGGGVSRTVDDFVIPCPPPTECKTSNRYECEFPIPEPRERVQSVLPIVATKETTTENFLVDTFAPNTGVEQHLELSTVYAMQNPVTDPTVMPHQPNTVPSVNETYNSTVATDFLLNTTTVSNQDYGDVNEYSKLSDNETIVLKTNGTSNTFKDLGLLSTEAAVLNINTTTKFDITDTVEPFTSSSTSDNFETNIMNFGTENNVTTTEAKIFVTEKILTETTQMHLENHTATETAGTVIATGPIEIENIVSKISNASNVIDTTIQYMTNASAINVNINDSVIVNTSVTISTPILDITTPAIQDVILTTFAVPVNITNGTNFMRPLNTTSTKPELIFTATTETVKIINPIDSVNASELPDKASVINVNTTSQEDVNNVSGNIKVNNTNSVNNIPIYDMTTITSESGTVIERGSAAAKITNINTNITNNITTSSTNNIVQVNITTQAPEVNVQVKNKSLTLDGETIKSDSDVAVTTESMIFLTTTTNTHVGDSITNTSVHNMLQANISTVTDSALNNKSVDFLTIYATTILPELINTVKYESTIHGNGKIFELLNPIDSHQSTTIDNMDNTIMELSTTNKPYEVFDTASNDSYISSNLNIINEVTTNNQFLLESATFVNTNSSEILGPTNLEHLTTTNAVIASSESSMNETYISDDVGNQSYVSTNENTANKITKNNSILVETVTFKPTILGNTEDSEILVTVDSNHSTADSDTVGILSKAPESVNLTYHITTTKPIVVETVTFEATIPGNVNAPGILEIANPPHLTTTDAIGISPGELSINKTHKLFDNVGNQSYAPTNINTINEIITHHQFPIETVTLASSILGNTNASEILVSTDLHYLTTTDVINIAPSELNENKTYRVSENVSNQSYIPTNANITNELNTNNKIIVESTTFKTINFGNPNTSEIFDVINLAPSEFSTNKTQVLDTVGNQSDIPTDVNFTGNINNDSYISSKLSNINEMTTTNSIPEDNVSKIQTLTNTDTISTVNDTVITVTELTDNKTATNSPVIITKIAEYLNTSEIVTNKVVNNKDTSGSQIYDQTPLEAIAATIKYDKANTVINMLTPLIHSGDFGNFYYEQETITTTTDTAVKSLAVNDIIIIQNNNDMHIQQEGATLDSKINPITQSIYPEKLTTEITFLDNIATPVIINQNSSPTTDISNSNSILIVTMPTTEAASDLLSLKNDDDKYSAIDIHDMTQAPKDVAKLGTTYLSVQTSEYSIDELTTKIVPTATHQIRPDVYNKLPGSNNANISIVNKEDGIVNITAIDKENNMDYESTKVTATATKPSIDIVMVENATLATEEQKRIMNIENIIKEDKENVFNYNNTFNITTTTSVASIKDNLAETTIPAENNNEETNFNEANGVLSFHLPSQVKTIDAKNSSLLLIENEVTPWNVTERNSTDVLSSSAQNFTIIYSDKINSKNGAEATASIVETIYLSSTHTPFTSKNYNEVGFSLYRPVNGSISETDKLQQNNSEPVPIKSHTSNSKNPNRIEIFQIENDFNPIVHNEHLLNQSILVNTDSNNGQYKKTILVSNDIDKETINKNDTNITATLTKNGIYQQKLIPKIVADPSVTAEEDYSSQTINNSSSKDVTNVLLGDFSQLNGTQLPINTNKLAKVVNSLPVAKNTATILDVQSTNTTSSNEKYREIIINEAMISTISNVSVEDLNLKTVGNSENNTTKIYSPGVLNETNITFELPNTVSSGLNISEYINKGITTEKIFIIQTHNSTTEQWNPEIIHSVKDYKESVFSPSINDKSNIKSNKDAYQTKSDTSAINNSNAKAPVMSITPILTPILKDIRQATLAANENTEIVTESIVKVKIQENTSSYLTEQTYHNDQQSVTHFTTDEVNQVLNIPVSSHSLGLLHQTYDTSTLYNITTEKVSSSAAEKVFTTDQQMYALLHEQKDEKLSTLYTVAPETMENINISKPSNKGILVERSEIQISPETQLVNKKHLTENFGSINHSTIAPSVSIAPTSIDVTKINISKTEPQILDTTVTLISSTTTSILDPITVTATTTEKYLPESMVQDEITTQTPMTIITSLTQKKLPEMNSPPRFSCRNRPAGRYADINDCRKFYICIGTLEAIGGSCPVNTVFSEIRKQCTRNLSHCIRNNVFKCASAGRFSDYTRSNVYYICIKKENIFVRYKLQCQNGYYLNKVTVRCYKISETTTSASQSVSIDSTSKVSEYKLQKKSDQENEEVFECNDEGKFADPYDCKGYFVCKKINNSGETYRRKHKTCDQDEIFHKEKKKCVDSSSYECSYCDSSYSNIYYVHVRIENLLLRFKFQCKSGFYLDKTTIKCYKIEKQSSNEAERESLERNTKAVNMDKKEYECKEEGIFPDPNNCRKYYICKKKNGRYKQKHKTCNKKEVFNSEILKCVDNLNVKKVKLCK